MLESRIACDGLMARLAEDIIESYDTGESGAALDDIIVDLLAYQRKTKQVTKGTIGASGTRALIITNTSALAALIQLHESIGGYMSVDNDWKLQWPTTIGADTGQQIRYRKNLKGITRDIDYLNYCTKLHLESSDESLSDIRIGPVDVDVDTDATYGYIILKETYAAYNEWTAEGDGVPALLSVYKETDSPAWKRGTGATGVGWTDESKAVDNDWDTYAYSAEVYGGSTLGVHIWTEYLTADIEDGLYSSCKFKAGHIGDIITYVEISAYDGADWTVIYSGSPHDGSDYEFSFSGQRMTEFRIRGQVWYHNYSKLKVFECQFLQADVIDDSANWVQGANERTMRCDIGDYDAGATYQISYNYANYLMAWDKIVTDEDIVAKLVTNKYEAYSLSLLESGILILDEMKVVPTTYDIDTIDLSHNEDFDFRFDALVIGSQVQVIDEDLGIDVNVRVVKIEHPDLLYPERMQIQLSTRVRDISDYLADLHKEF